MSHLCRWSGIRSVLNGGIPSVGCRSLTESAGSQSTTTRTSRTGPTTANDPHYDLVIIGGGIIGTATGRALALRHHRSHCRMAILEKDSIAAHQSGHNSGVIHAGVYYTPGSLKARLCVEGSRLAYDYCDDHRIPYKKCGKLIVAFSKSEGRRLVDLFRRGQENGVAGLELIKEHAIRDFEPHCKGVSAIWSPETGIVDWAQVTRSFADDFKHAGDNVIHTGFQVHKIDYQPDSGLYPIRITSAHGDRVSAKYLVTAAGLYADRIAQLTGCDPYPKIIPFRGEYLVLRSAARHLVRGNIYPVPDPSLPFLGVHFTPRMNGDIWCGPNAILATAREGYDRLDVNTADLMDAVTSPGLLRLAARNLVFGLREIYTSRDKSRQLTRLQRFIPELRSRDIMEGPTGVRAQAISRAGDLVDDFVFDTPPKRRSPTSQSWNHTDSLSDRVIHVRNAPSPAATSSLAIARVIVDKIDEHFHLSTESNDH